MPQMEALVFDRRAKSLVYDGAREIPTPQGPRDVVVRVAYSGVCGTDLHVMEGSFPCEERRPFVLGHEFCGVIEAAGPQARFPVGTRVAVDPNSGCGACPSCRSGRYHLCPVGGIASTIGLRCDGGWAQFCAVPDSQAVPLPDEVDFERGALTEPLSCLARGLDRVGPIPIGEEILLCGAGIIGNLWAVTLHLQGHRSVTVSELDANRRSVAQNMGLSGYSYTSPAELKASGKLFDLIVDCTGVARAFEDTLPLAKPAARYVLFGCCNPEHDARVNPFQIYAKELTIIGVNVNPFTFPKALGLLKSLGPQYLDYEKLGIGVFRLKDYQEAIAKLKRGEIAKAVFKLI